MLLPILAPQQITLPRLPEPPPAIVKPVELSLEEKIKQNFYKCDTLTQYIRADNAQCLAKPINTPVAAEKPSEVPQNTSDNLFEPGQCVWFIKNRRPEIPNSFGSAYQWVGNAQAIGWPTGSVPRVNAVGVRGNHVVLIESINPDGSVNIIDMNGRYIPFEIGHGTHPANYYTYIY